MTESIYDDYTCRSAHTESACNRTLRGAMSDDDDEEAEGLCARLLERDDGFTPAGIIMRGC